MNHRLGNNRDGKMFLSGCHCSRFIHRRQCPGLCRQAKTRVLWVAPKPESISSFAFSNYREKSHLSGWETVATQWVPTATLVITNEIIVSKAEQNRSTMVNRDSDLEGASGAPSVGFSEYWCDAIQKCNEQSGSCSESTIAGELQRCTDGLK